MKAIVDYLFEETNRVVGIEDEVFKYLDDMSNVSNELVALAEQKQNNEIKTSEINTQIAEAKAYLASTDFYMTVDKYAELDEAKKVELTTKRAEARELINTLEAELKELEGVNDGN